MGATPLVQVCSLTERRDSFRYFEAIIHGLRVMSVVLEELLSSTYPTIVHFASFSLETTWHNPFVLSKIYENAESRKINSLSTCTRSDHRVLFLQHKTATKFVEYRCKR